jgi:hypothetical protein
LRPVANLDTKENRPMPQYFMYTTPDPDAPAVEPSPELYEEMGKLIAEQFASGKLVATGSLDPLVTKIVHRGDNFTLTDGPFTEAKELVVGWAIVKVDSKEEAIELSKRFWRLVGDGSGIIQRIFEPGEGPLGDIEIAAPTSSVA